LTPLLGCELAPACGGTDLNVENLSSQFTLGRIMKRKRTWWLILLILFSIGAGYLWIGGEGRIIGIHEFEPGSKRGGILGIAPDGRLLAAGNDQLVLIDGMEVEVLSKIDDAYVYGPLKTGTNAYHVVQPNLVRGGLVKMYDWSGSKLWDYEFSGQLGMHSTGSDESIYLAAGGSVIHALNPDGSLRWTNHYGIAGGSPPSSPVVSKDGRIALSGGTNGLVVLDRNGAELWRDSTTGNTDFMGGDALFAPDGDLILTHKWNVSRYDGNGVVQWKLGLPLISGRATTNSFVNYTPVFGPDETIYCVGENFLFAISPTG
jgi:hypothetical protein